MLISLCRPKGTRVNWPIPTGSNSLCALRGMKNNKLMRPKRVEKRTVRSVSHAEPTFDSVTRRKYVSGRGNEIRPTPPHSGPSSTSDMNILQTNFSFSSSQDASNFPCLPFFLLFSSSVLFYPFIHMRFIFVADFTFNLVAVCLMPSLFFSFRLFFLFTLLCSDAPFRP